MEVMPQTMPVYQPTGAAGSQAAGRTQSSDELGFKSMLREKAGTTPDDTAAQDKGKAEVMKKPEATAKNDEISTEQYAAAAAMMAVVPPAVQPNVVVVEEAEPAFAAVEADPAQAVELPQLVQTQEMPAEVQAQQAEEQPQQPVLSTQENTVRTAEPAPEQAQAVQQPEAPAVQQKAESEQAQNDQPQAEDDAQTANATVTVVRQSRPEAHEEKADNETEEQIPAEAPLFAELEATPIRVADAPKEAEPAVPLDQPETPQLMADRLERSLAAEEPTVVLEVEPANLGPIKVTFMRSEGALQVMMEAVNPRSAALLERHQQSLQQILAQDTRYEVRVEVQTAEQQQQLTPDDHNANQNGGQQQNGREHSKPETEDFLQKLRLGLNGSESEDS